MVARNALVNRRDALKVRMMKQPRTTGIAYQARKSLALNAIADYFGHQCHRVCEILSSKAPIIVEVNMDPYQELTPRLQNKLNKDGTFSIPSYDDLYPHINDKELEFERARARSII